MRFKPADNLVHCNVFLISYRNSYFCFSIYTTKVYTATSVHLLTWVHVFFCCFIFWHGQMDLKQ